MDLIDTDNKCVSSTGLTNEEPLDHNCNTGSKDNERDTISTTTLDNKSLLKQKKQKRELAKLEMNLVQHTPQSPTRRRKQIRSNRFGTQHQQKRGRRHD